MNSSYRATNDLSRRPHRQCQRRSAYLLPACGRARTGYSAPMAEPIRSSARHTSRQPPAQKYSCHQIFLPIPPSCQIAKASVAVRRARCSCWLHGNLASAQSTVCCPTNHEPRSVDSLIRWSPTTAGRLPQPTTRLRHSAPPGPGRASGCHLTAKPQTFAANHSASVCNRSLIHCLRCSNPTPHKNARRGKCSGSNGLRLRLRVDFEPLSSRIAPLYECITTLVIPSRAPTYTRKMPVLLLFFFLLLSFLSLAFGAKQGLQTNAE
jgi:hypothetical protein